MLYFETIETRKKKLAGAGKPAHERTALYIPLTSQDMHRISWPSWSFHWILEAILPLRPEGHVEVDTSWCAPMASGHRSSFCEAHRSSVVGVRGMKL